MLVEGFAIDDRGENGNVEMAFRWGTRQGELKPNNWVPSTRRPGGIPVEQASQNVASQIRIPLVPGYDTCIGDAVRNKKPRRQ